MFLREFKKKSSNSYNIKFIFKVVFSKHLSWAALFRIYRCATDTVPKGREHDCCFHQISALKGTTCILFGKTQSHDALQQSQKIMISVMKVSLRRPSIINLTLATRKKFSLLVIDLFFKYTPSSQTQTSLNTLHKLSLPLLKLVHSNEKLI